MIGTRAALRYARAAVQKAIEDGNLDTLAKDMDVVYNTVQNNRDLEAVLQSPMISADLKHNTLQGVFARVAKQVKTFYVLLHKIIVRITSMELPLR